MEVVKKDIEKETAVAVIATETVSLMGTVSDIKIWDQKSYDYAKEILKDILTKIKSVDDVLGKRKELAYKSYKSISKLIDDMKSPLESLKRKLNFKLGFYLEEQRAIKEKADAEARKIEEDGRLAHAQILEDHDMHEAADKVIDKPVVAAASTVKKVEQGGTYLVDNWSAEVTNLRDLLTAILNDDADISLIAPNYSKLNRMARDLKARLNIPGVKAIKQTSTRTRL